METEDETRERREFAKSRNIFNNVPDARLPAKKNDKTKKKRKRDDEALPPLAVAEIVEPIQQQQIDQHLKIEIDSIFPFEGSLTSSGNTTKVTSFAEQCTWFLYSM